MNKEGIREKIEKVRKRCKIESEMLESHLDVIKESSKQQRRRVLGDYAAKACKDFAKTLKN